MSGSLGGLHGGDGGIELGLFRGDGQTDGAEESLHFPRYIERAAERIVGLARLAGLGGWIGISAGLPFLSGGLRDGSLSGSLGSGLGGWGGRSLCRGFGLGGSLLARNPLGLYGFHSDVFGGFRLLTRGFRGFFCAGGRGFLARGLLGSAVLVEGGLFCGLCHNGWIKRQTGRWIEPVFERPDGAVLQRAVVSSRGEMGRVKRNRSRR